MHPLVHGFDQLVHVRPAPVVLRELSARGDVLVVSLGVGKVDPLAGRVVLGIRIEVVVDVHAIDVVALDDVHDRAQRAATHFWVARIHPEEPAVLPNELRIGLRDVRARDRRVAIVRCPVGIEPRVQLEPTLVRLLDRERQRVPRRLRPSALPPRDVLRPRFVRRRIQRVRAGADVKHDRVHVERDHSIEDRQQLPLLLPGRQPLLRRPINIPDRRDPHGPEFPINRLRRLGRCYTRRERRNDQCPNLHAPNLAPEAGFALTLRGVCIDRSEASQCPSGGGAARFASTPRTELAP